VVTQTFSGRLTKEAGGVPFLTFSPTEAGGEALNFRRSASMVDDALQKLAEENIIDMDDEPKELMVSNLLVVLTCESQTQPVVNAGSLY